MSRLQFLACLVGFWTLEGVASLTHEWRFEVAGGFLGLAVFLVVLGRWELK